MADLIRKKGDVLCQSKGVTTQQWLVMLHLAHDPNIPFIDATAPDDYLTSSDLANALNVSRPNVTSIINSLMEKGMVEQRDDEFDRRVKRIVLTPLGNKVLEEIQPIRQMANARLFGHFDAIERDHFLDLLIVCVKRLSA
jgi:DNA-binding MarR family transcriptional regulator